MQNLILRYSNVDLPYYKYIPGKGRHPKERQCVHIPQIKEQINEFNNKNWNISQRYLYAIDLFNEQYYWEMHEVLEVLWLKLGRNSETGCFLQGLIQLSIALLKKNLQNKVGMLRLKEKAIKKISVKEKIYLGIEVKAFLFDTLNFIDDKSNNSPQIYLGQ